MDDDRHSDAGRAHSVATMMIEEYGFDRAMTRAHLTKLEMEGKGSYKNQLFGASFWDLVIAALHTIRKGNGHGETQRTQSVSKTLCVGLHQYISRS